MSIIKKYNKLIFQSFIFYMIIGLSFGLGSIVLAKMEYINGNPCLVKVYKNFKNDFTSARGRVKDPERNDLSTSEGQGYMLTLAVVVGDRNEFDKVYKWTKEKLQRKDKLFAWLWDKDKNGQYKIIDNNSASDADVNIALALCFAHVKWGGEKYLEEALPIIQAIWEKETRKIGRYRILMPGAIQAKSDRIEINPSYFHPYAFKFFKKYDKKHNWDEVLNASYFYIKESSKKTKTKLPPNWFLLKNGKIVLEDSERSDFSYDAIRVFKKAYIDYIRTGDLRGLEVLSKSKFFIDNWKTSKNIYTNYKASGQPRDLNEYLGSVITLIPCIAIYDPKVAKEIFKAKIEPYLNNSSIWLVRKDYYTKNLLWHGCHFYFNTSLEWYNMYEVSRDLLKK